MDPLSITASVLTVLGTIGTVSKTVQSLASLRNAPETLLQLNNEVSDLQLTMIAINEQIGEESSATVQQQILYKGLEKARSLVLELQCSIEYDLTKVSSSGRQKINKIAWLRAENKMQKIKDRLLEVKVDLNLGLSLINGCTSSRMELTLRHIITSNEQIARKVPAIDTMLREHLTSLWKPYNIDRDAPLAFVADSSVIQAPETTLELNPYSIRSEHLARDYSLTTRLGCNYTPSVQGSSRQSDDVPTIGLKLNYKRKCDSYCICSCHRRHGLGTPRVAECILGSLFIGYQGLPIVHNSCNQVDCSGSSSTTIRLAYVFPSWLLHRAVCAYASWSQNRGPEMIIRTVRIRPNGSKAFQAIWSGCSSSAKVLRELLANNEASVLDVTMDGNSLLQLAVEFRRVEMVELLLKAGADPLLEGNRVNSAFREAMSQFYWFKTPNKEVNAVWQLITNSVERELFEFTDLHKSILDMDSVDFNQRLRSTPRSMINQSDCTGSTALFWAASRGDVCKVIKLLAHGADPDLTSKDGKTPLMMAARLGHIECVKTLLDAGANVEIADDCGQTAVHSAALSHEKVVEMLLKAGANIDSINRNSWTPLYLALDYHTTQFMVENGANINIRDDSGKTPLLHAILVNWLEAVQALVDLKADYCLYGQNGNGLLDYAALSGSLETLAILKAAGLHGLAIDHENHRGSTAIDKAIWRRDHNAQWAYLYLQNEDDDPQVWFDEFVALIDSIKDPIWLYAGHWDQVEEEEAAEEQSEEEEEGPVIDEADTDSLTDEDDLWEVAPESPLLRSETKTCTDSVDQSSTRPFSETTEKGPSVGLDQIDL